MTVQRLFPIFLLILLFVSIKCDSIEEPEGNIIGLEEFLLELDPETSDIVMHSYHHPKNNFDIQILELLEAQQHPTPKANRAMRKIMEKLPASELNKLFQIYKQTRD
ncbi:unnamed protein product [Caenorhabditis bovis]|uniref:SXP/RAL-2 family protein Ani s 5-like cation-binding domain-containing protein n=1 Tax=Caenorhabditis bovis TaxID=2654633 RepID=A0A8S1EF37_9PELO|nr:unnamed protein product [Caenorhabditis bovis]